MKLIESIFRTAIFFAVVVGSIYILDRFGLIDEAVRLVDSALIKLKKVLWSLVSSKIIRMFIG